MEVWKSIKGYEGIYKINSCGKVKTKSKIRKNRLNKYGYYDIQLSLNGTAKTYQIHQLVAIAFLNHVPNGHNLVINHKDGCKTNNNVENLEIVTMRDNSSICFRKYKRKFTSKFIGVCWCKLTKKWSSEIVVKGKKIHIGLYENELDAAKAYQEYLKSIL